MSNIGKAPAAIEINHLQKSFRGNFSFRATPIIQDLSFAVEQGAIFGFLGPNGAGKTTTIRMVMGLIRPDICSQP